VCSHFDCGTKLGSEGKRTRHMGSLVKVRGMLWWNTWYFAGSVTDFGTERALYRGKSRRGQAAGRHKPHRSRSEPGDGKTGENPAIGVPGTGDRD